MRTIFDESYGNKEYEKVDWYLPDGEISDLLVWFHGGGLENGTRKDICFAEKLTAQGVAVCSVEYSLYPSAKFPDYIKDCAKAVAYSAKRAEEIGCKGKFYVSGQSAGAYITLMLCLDKRYFEEVGFDRNRIDGYISDSAQTTTHFNVLRERGIPSAYERIDDGAPLYFVSAECDYKSLLLLCYENDMPCRVTQNKLLYESLLRHYPQGKIALKVLPGWHVHGSTVLNENGSYDFVDEVLAFIK